MTAPSSPSSSPDRRLLGPRLKVGVLVVEAVCVARDVEHVLGHIICFAEALNCYLVATSHHQAMCILDVMNSGL